ncbi:MAG: hypothetical protein OEY34_03655 [Cyclobacteriaceae bacterium]|nr:hypothetical protein [Cyclobacteriaceae bacterium]
MLNWKEKIIHANEVTDLFAAYEGEWLLLEVLSKGNAGKAETFNLIHHNPDKNVLHDFMMDECCDDSDNHFMLIYADPHKPCDL